MFVVPHGVTLNKQGHQHKEHVDPQDTQGQQLTYDNLYNMLDVINQASTVPASNLNCQDLKPYILPHFRELSSMPDSFEVARTALPQCLLPQRCRCRGGVGSCSGICENLCTPFEILMEM